MGRRGGGGYPAPLCDSVPAACLLFSRLPDASALWHAPQRVLGDWIERGHTEFSLEDVRAILTELNRLIARVR